MDERVDRGGGGAISGLADRHSVDVLAAESRRKDWACGFSPFSIGLSAASVLSAKP